MAVSPAAGPGIYDILLPILQQWNAQYDFTGSYYVNIGDNPTGASESTTDWARSLTYYHAIEALGSEIGTHSYSHIISPPTTTFTAHTSIAFFPSDHCPKRPCRFVGNCDRRNVHRSPRE